MDKEIAITIAYKAIFLTHAPVGKRFGRLMDVFLGSMIVFKSASPFSNPLNSLGVVHPTFLSSKLNQCNDEDNGK